MRGIQSSQRSAVTRSARSGVSRIHSESSAATLGRWTVASFKGGKHDVKLKHPMHSKLIAHIQDCRLLALRGV